MELPLTPRRRGGADAPRDALGENWKSALCVTSLYDSYVAVQHENDALKDQLRDLQHELALARQPKKTVRWAVLRPETNDKPAITEDPHKDHAERDGVGEDGDHDDDDDDDDGYARLAQEIRLLRAEKAQQALLFDKRRAQLEATVAQLGADYAELQTKYQHKCDLDPLAPQRVALSTRALQQALDQSVRDKEELAAALARLQQLCQQADAERSAMAQTLRDQHESLARERHAQAARSVRAALAKWAHARLASAWQQWRLVALSERVCASHALAETQQRETQVRARREAAETRARAFLAKMLQTATQRRFEAWRRFVDVQTRRRGYIEAMRRSRLRRVWHTWQQQRHARQCVGQGAARLATLLHRHATRRAWQRWQAHANATTVARQQRAVEALHAHVATLEATVQELLRSVETATAQREQLTAQAHDAAIEHRTREAALLQSHRRTRDKIAELLFQRGQRRSLRGTLYAWRQTTSARRWSRHRTDTFAAARAARALHKTIAHWHGVAHAQRRFQLVARRAVQRMRLLGAFRCFAAWRAFASESQERVATLARVVRYMTSQLVARSFRAWQQFRSERQHQRERLTSLCAIVARVQLAGGVAAWRKASAALGRQAEQHKRQEIETAWRARLEQSKRELQVLRGVFQAWQRSTRRGRRFRQLARACAAKWTSGAQGRSFAAWREFVARRRGIRDALRRLVAKRATSELLTAVARWRTHTLVRAKQAALEQIERERDARVTLLEAELAALRLADAAARATSAEREHQLVGQLEAAQAALVGAKQSCTQYKTALRGVCLTLHQKKTRLACLRAWQAVWQRARQREQLVTLALARQHSHTTRLVMARWHALAQRRQRMLSTAGHLQRRWRHHVLGECHRAWHAYATHERRVREATQTFARNARRRLGRRVLTTWREATRATRLLRHTLEQIWLSSVHAHLRDCFATWRERAAQLKLQDALQRRQRAVDAIRTRVCARWSARSLEQVLAAWREGVANQKRARAGEQRLRRLHDQRLFEIAFTAWQRHRAQHGRQRAWLLAWQTRRERQAVASSWREWKELTIQKRQHTVALLQETCHQRAQALAATHEQLMAMEQHQERLRAQVETLERAHGDAGETAARLARAVALTKWLYQWRLFVHVRHTQKVRLERTLQLHRTRFQQRVVRAWAAEVAAQRARARAANDKALASSRRQLRTVLVAWMSFVQETQVTNRVVRRLQARRARQTQRAMLHDWLAFVRRCHAARRVGAVLAKLTRTVSQRGAFATWLHATRSYRARADTQRRVLAFLMDKQCYAVAKYFSAWRSLGMARHVRLEAAHKMAQRARLHQLRALWGTWQASRAWKSRCVRSVSSLVRVVARQWIRTTFQHWRTQVTRDRIATLTSTNEQHKLVRQALQLELDAAQNDAIRLRESLEALQIHHDKLSDDSRGSVAATEARVRDAQRLLAFHRLLTRAHCVPRSTLATATAFQRWQRHAVRDGLRTVALSRCAQMILRKQQARSFSRWRRRAAASDRLATRRFWRDTQLCRRVFCAWTQVVRDCAVRRRRFLVRWIEATHTCQVQAALEKKTAMAFRIWQLHAANERARQRWTTHTADRDAADASNRAHQRRHALLAKWSWRAYNTRCQELRGVVVRWYGAVQRDKLAVVQAQLLALQADGGVRRGSGSVTETVVPRAAQSLQALFRHLAAAQSSADLFDAVASSLAQLSLGSASGVLYLLDPTTNELWTQRRDAPETVQAPASLGLAGSALSSLSTLIVENAATDARFHPLVDQLAVAGVVAASRVDLFTTTIVGADGAAYGVVQIAFRPDEHPNTEATQTHVRLLGHACGFFVEQIVYDMVRHARDRKRARTPQSFAKLFKQTKHWRKYFVQVEKEAQRTQHHLTQLLAEQDALVDEKQRLLDALGQLEREQRAVAEQRETNKQQSDTHERLVTHLLSYKKKTAKVKELAQEKDRLLSEKTRELERALAEFAAYKQQVQAREWQQALRTAASPKTRKRTSGETTSREEEESNDEPTSMPQTRRLRGPLLEGAEVATLQNQLVRAESDSMLLVKAVDVATRHHGELPEALKMEVNRISLRLKKPRE